MGGFFTRLNFNGRSRTMSIIDIVRNGTLTIGRDGHQTGIILRDLK